jgi:hypothetical protein
MYIRDCVHGNCVNRKNVRRVETGLLLQHYVQRRTRIHRDELTSVVIDVVVEIETKCRMNDGHKNRFWERWPKGICAKSDGDTVVAINVRCCSSCDDGERRRCELIHWERNEFADKRCDGFVARA